MSRNDSFRFREVQRIRDPVLWFVVTTVALLLAVVSVAEPMTLLARGLLFAVGVGSVAFLWATRLVVAVGPDTVTIRVGPVGRRRAIPAADVQSVSRHRHRSATTFGRWGIHLGLGDPPTYNVAGDEGVVLRLTEGTVIVGTARPAELLAALRGLDTELAEPPGDWPLRGRATSLGSVTGDGFVTRSKE